MEVIVEDGSRSNSNANSYISAAQATEFISSRGGDVSQPSGMGVIVLKAMDYLESFGDRFKGCRVSRDQPLSWPRSGALIEDWYWSGTEIPRQVLNAQYALVLEIFNGEDPWNPSANDNLVVTRERIEGALEVEYANPRTAAKVAKTQPSAVHIRLLLDNAGMRVVRA